jgi:HK97 family phage portal protein
MAWWNFWRKENRSNVVFTNFNGDNNDSLLLSDTGVQTNTNINVTSHNAMENTAVGAAVRILSESIASLPLVLYQKTDEDSRKKAADHPLYPLLHDQANDYMTAMVFRELLQSHVLLWGNGYAEIEWNNKGEPVALWPLRPDLTWPFIDVNDKKLYYQTNINGETFYLPAYRVFHVHGLGSDGFSGKSLIKLHREAIGLAKATEKYGSKYFGNGAKPGGVLEHPGNLSDTAGTNLRTSWNTMHSGLDNAHRIAILEEGMTYKQIGLPPEDSQFLETRKFQVEEVSRIFRVPLHMLGSLDRATFSNIEHQGIEFVTHTLRPWFVRWEQAISMRLLVGSEKKQLYAEHNADALLRGDIKNRYDAYAVARQNGWMSTNDIRKRENMEPIPGGDVYLVNGNMIPIDVAAQASNPNLKGGEGGNGQGTAISNNNSGASGE